MSSENDQEDLYDEFGNYIGPDLDDDDDDESKEDSDASTLNEDDHVEEDRGDDGRGRERQMVVASRLDDDGDETMLAAPATAIVLHEDKEHYLSAEETYGAGVRTAVIDEDAQDLSTPIVAPDASASSARSHFLSATTSASTGDVVDQDYLNVLLSNETTRTRRGVAIVGHFHHGKTSLVDLILESTHHQLSSETSKNGTPQLSRFTDVFRSEQLREMSLTSTPVTTTVRDARGKSYALTVVDCPGHPNFHDETVAALRLVDGAVLVVDALEGPLLHTEMVIRQCVSEGLPIILVVSKVDRLIVELRLPPRDAYFKILNLLDTVNQIVEQASGGRYPPLSPDRNNVAFSSSQHGWLFTLESFAQAYLDRLQRTVGHSAQLGTNLTVSDFASRLWGDCYLDPETRTFHRHWRDCPSQSVTSSHPRTFCQFVLEPLYKIYSVCLGEREHDVNAALRSVGVFLSKPQLRDSPRPLLRAALSQFFGGRPSRGGTTTNGGGGGGGGGGVGGATAVSGLVDAIVRGVPCPAAAARAKVARCYTGPTDSPVAQSMVRCDPRGPLVIHVTKLYFYGDSITQQGPGEADAGGGGGGTRASSSTFAALGRIYSGTVRPAQKVYVLGEGYRPEEDEDMAVAVVDAISIPGGRGKSPTSLLKAGNYVLLEGIDATIAKTATLVGVDALNVRGDGSIAMSDENPVHIFAPLTFPQCGGESVVKVAVEPVNPAELPKMVEGLRRISKAYPMARTKVEESGEHILLGTGELYLDCILHDLRNVYSDIEIKVADPIVAFRETVTEASSVKCFAETANKRNRLTCVAEPLDDGLAERLEAGKIDLNWEKKKIGRFFQTQYDWDLLSSRSVWAFGDSPTHGPNLLLDDTLPSEVDKKLLNTCKNSIVQGFQWAMREGPLCEEPVRATKIKILDAVFADKPIHRGGGQVIPSARRTVHSSLLTATPRLMEPVYRLQIVCPGAIVEPVQPVLTRRRGHIVQDHPIPGALMHTVKGYLPVLDSFGFETDLRTFTQGQAMVLSVFDHWAVAPGDPLDRSIQLHPLEPSPPHCLARELLIKTRRRKGLSEDVALNKFFDEGMKAHISSLQDSTSASS